MQSLPFCLKWNKRTTMTKVSASLHSGTWALSWARSLFVCIVRPADCVCVSVCACGRVRGCVFMCVCICPIMSRNIIFHLSMSIRLLELLPDEDPYLLMCMSKSCRSIAVVLRFDFHWSWLVVYKWPHLHLVATVIDQGHSSRRRIVPPLNSSIDHYYVQMSFMPFHLNFYLHYAGKQMTLPEINYVW